MTKRFQMGVVVDWAPHSVTPTAQDTPPRKGTLPPNRFALEEKSSR